MPKKKPFHAKKNKGPVTTATNNNFTEKFKPNTITCEAQVIEVLPDTTFKVQLKDIDSTASVTLSGKMRINYIKILKGDWVTVELSTYDLTKGRITYRHKNFNFKNNNHNNSNT